MKYNSHTHMNFEKSRNSIHFHSSLSLFLYTHTFPSVYTKPHSALRTAAIIQLPVEFTHGHIIWFFKKFLFLANHSSSAIGYREIRLCGFLASFFFHLLHFLGSVPFLVPNVEHNAAIKYRIRSCEFCFQLSSSSSVPIFL